LANGVVEGENYRILSLDKIYNSKTGEESKLLRLKSTTGCIHKDYTNGNEIENSEKLGRGEFWMPYQNW
jgi:hypothetical protein